MNHLFWKYLVLPLLLLRSHPNRRITKAFQGRRESTRHDSFVENIRANILEIVPYTLGFEDVFRFRMIRLFFVFRLRMLREKKGKRVTLEDPNLKKFIQPKLNPAEFVRKINYKKQIKLITKKFLFSLFCLFLVRCLD